ncbi:MAG: rhamnan synthesis F family protein [Pseudomonadota bacterium]
MMHPQKTRVGIFAHYDRHNSVDDHVYYFLRSLVSHVERLYMVSTSSIGRIDLNRLESLGITVSTRCNEGLDFASYAAVINKLDLSSIDEVLICNDSVYGPLFPFAEMLDSMDEKNLDFWGASSSKEIRWHLQSFFIVFRKSALNASAFREFWSNVKSLGDKQRIIREYEIGLTQSLRKAGMIGGSYVGPQPHEKSLLAGIAHYGTRLRKRVLDRRFYVNLPTALKQGALISENPLHDNWLQLIECYRFPFVKVQLLRDNPKSSSSVSSYAPSMQRLTDYPVALIRSHLKRTTKA